jgi:UDP-N-acetylmuramoyl-L-alanyl-D-glutamate--2,6-diaminopimelate ligase
VSHDESDISVIVDYAHKPEALEAALRAISGIAVGRIWAVFGAGGDRDKGKRPLMGKIASELADFVIITSDNPRFENPEVIAEEITGNIEEFAVELDRDTAIGSAISKAKPGDAVLIAGKGHEKVQIFGSSELPFDDVAIAQKNLYLRKAAKGKRS